MKNDGNDVELIKLSENKNGAEYGLFEKSSGTKITYYDVEFNGRGAILH